MDRNAILLSVFVISILVASGSLRASAAVGPNKDSPLPSPSPSEKVDASKKNTSELNSRPSKPKSDPNLTDSHKLDASPPPVLPAVSNSPISAPHDSENNSSLTSQSSDGKGHIEMDANRDKTKTHNVPDASPKKIPADGVCKVKADRCKDDGNLIACFQDFEQASKKLLLLVINSGEENLTVNIKVPASAGTDIRKLQLSKHTQQKINVSVNAGGNSEIVLNAGNGTCILLWKQAPVSAGAHVSTSDFFRWLPSYATRMTPIYGAYLFFLSVLIIGGIWACCKFGKRGRGDGGGVPYQELEMGLPQSSSARVVDTADGWDQGWDDIWEEGKAVSRTQEIPLAGNVSLNGLTSRSTNTNREGWDDDWED